LKENVEDAYTLLSHVFHHQVAGCFWTFFNRGRKGEKHFNRGRKQFKYKTL